MTNATPPKSLPANQPAQISLVSNAATGNNAGPDSLPHAARDITRPSEPNQPGGPNDSADNAEKIATIEAAIRTMNRHQLRGVRCVVGDGFVLIQGQVPSFYHKQLCQEAIRPLVIGTQILNQLIVQSHGG